MDSTDLKTMLAEYGELMVKVAEFGDPFELHLHDTDIGDNEVRLELTDGIVTFGIDDVTGAWYHTHSLADFGLD